MIQIGSTILSLDVIEKKFACNYAKCKGICCVEGDAGAPLTDEEITQIEQALPDILPLLSPENQKTITQKGIFYIDLDKEKVTSLVNHAECAFVITENSMYSCAIERAWEQGKCELQKPISCHLYPIRIKKYHDFEGVHYDSWHICKDAIVKGNNKGIRVFEFCKTALIRKYGKDWYAELEIIASQWELETNKTK